ncbi:MAG: FAD-dependent monooxygenase [Propionibacteriaceae bacterium]
MSAEITATALPIDQDDHGVTTELGGTGSRPLRSRYLLAADGLHSPIRHRLGWTGVRAAGAA